MRVFHSVGSLARVRVRAYVPFGQPPSYGLNTWQDTEARPFAFPHPSSSLAPLPPPPNPPPLWAGH
jgi:hypothetical protein